MHTRGTSRPWPGTALWTLVLLLVSSGFAYAQEVTYPVAPPADPDAGSLESEASTMLSAEMASIQEVVVAGDELVYDEAAGYARWSGNVRLTAGSLVLTAEELNLTFVTTPDPADPEGAPEAVIQTLSAGPEVDITLDDDLLRIHGEALEYSFPERSGQVIAAVVDVSLPAELIARIAETPLQTGGVRTTILSASVQVQGEDVTIEEPEITLLTEAGQSIRLTATRIQLLNPNPDTTRMRTRNLRLELNGITVLKVPWTQSFNLRGTGERGGFDVDFPHLVNAEEGLGLYTDVLYGFGPGQGSQSAPWTVGTHIEWIFADRAYIEQYLSYLQPDVGEWRLVYGVTREESVLDFDSLPVRQTPELQFAGDSIELTRYLSIRPEAGIGHIEELSTGRESDRTRLTLNYALPKLRPLGKDRHFTMQIFGKVDQRWYEHGWSQRIGEVSLATQFYKPGVYGTEIRWIRRDDTGFSPFLHDREQLKEEIRIRQRAVGADDWGTALSARYDLEEDRWRNFAVGISRRFELLEGTLYWDTVTESIRFELGFPGQI